MASTSKASDAWQHPVYEPEFETTMERRVALTKLKCPTFLSGSDSRFGVPSLHWGRVPFDLKLKVIETDDESHKNVILDISCNSKAVDPHWRCNFTVRVQCTESLVEFETIERTMDANKDNKEMVIPIMRAQEDDPALSQGNLLISIKMNSWAGNFPDFVRSFSTKSNVTDATLIVEGRPFHVCRGILGMCSTYFNTLLYDTSYVDAGKSEIELPDISYDDMELFLSLVYPNMGQQRKLRTMDEIESMLQLSDRFGSDSLKKLLEKYLMGEMDARIEGFTRARRLLLADKYRLSAPCSHIMDGLRSEESVQELGATDEYWQLSESIRSAILDLRMKRTERETGPYCKRFKMDPVTRSGRSNRWDYLMDPNDDPDIVPVGRLSPFSAHSNSHRARAASPPSPSAFSLGFHAPLPRRTNAATKFLTNIAGLERAAARMMHACQTRVQAAYAAIRTISISELNKLPSHLSLNDLNSIVDNILTGRPASGSIDKLEELAAWRRGQSTSKRIRLRATPSP